MSAAADILDGLDPGLHFKPSDDELVALYLLPRVRGQQDPFHGLIDVIVEDDTAANTQPWELFERHGCKDAFPAFFCVHTKDAKAGARPDRRCIGGGTWKSQKREREDPSHGMVVDGERIQWSKHNLNLHMGSGSIGWVMNEYSISDCPSLKICRISFSGYGQKRMRVPDGEPESQRRRVAVAAPSDPRTTPNFDQETEHVSGAVEHEQLQQETGQVHGACVAAAGEPTFVPVCSGAMHDSSAQQVPADDFIAEMIQEMIDTEYQVPTTMEQGVMKPLPMVQEFWGVLGTMEQGHQQGETAGVPGAVEQLDGAVCHGAHAVGVLGMPTFDQVYSGVVHDSAEQTPSNDFIPQMVQDGNMQQVPTMMEQQAADGLSSLPMVQESGTAEQVYACQRFCSEEETGGMAAGMLDGLSFGGFFFC